MNKPWEIAWFCLQKIVVYLKQQAGQGDSTLSLPSGHTAAAVAAAQARAHDSGYAAGAFDGQPLQRLPKLEPMIPAMPQAPSMGSRCSGCPISKH